MSFFSSSLDLMGKKKMSEPTKQQLKYIKSLGGDPKKIDSSSKASKRIEELQESEKHETYLLVYMDGMINRSKFFGNFKEAIDMYIEVARKRNMFDPVLIGGNILFDDR